MPFAELCATSNFDFLTGASHPEEYAREAAALGLQAFAIADANSVAGIVRAHQALRELAQEGAVSIRQTDNIGHEDVVARAHARVRSGPLRDPRDDTPEEREALSAAAAGEVGGLGGGGLGGGGTGWQGRGPAMTPGRDGPEPVRTGPPEPGRVEDGPTKPPGLALPPVQALTLPRLIPAATLVLEDGQRLVALPRDRPAWGRLTRLLTLGKRRAEKGDCHLEFEDVV
ncbi:MAG: hypothetical protein AAF192_23065, partial [Pseudomonadota bacterium]